jgi:hypothetical protein
MTTATATTFAAQVVRAQQMLAETMSLLITSAETQEQRDFVASAVAALAIAERAVGKGHGLSA